MFIIIEMSLFVFAEIKTSFELLRLSFCWIVLIALYRFDDLMIL